MALQAATLDQPDTARLGDLKASGKLELCTKQGGNDVVIEKGQVWLTSLLGSLKESVSI